MTERQEYTGHASTPGRDGNLLVRPQSAAMQRVAAMEEVNAVSTPPRPGYVLELSCRSLQATR